MLECSANASLRRRVELGVSMKGASEGKRGSDINLVSGNNETCGDSRFQLESEVGSSQVRDVKRLALIETVCADKSAVVNGAALQQNNIQDQNNNALEKNLSPSSEPAPKLSSTQVKLEEQSDFQGSETMIMSQLMEPVKSQAIDSQQAISDHEQHQQRNLSHLNSHQNHLHAAPISRLESPLSSSSTGSAPIRLASLNGSHQSPPGENLSDFGQRQATNNNIGGGDLRAQTRADCAGCRAPITDKFIFSVIDLNWHQDCVQCAECQRKLDDKCFTQDGKLYCRDDYLRRFGPKCQACLEPIERSELVHRIRGNQIYHLKCFICQHCRKQLRAGEQFRLVDGKKLLCKQDFGNYQLSQHHSNQFSPNGDPSGSGGPAGINNGGSIPEAQEDESARRGCVSHPSLKEPGQSEHNSGANNEAEHLDELGESLRRRKRRRIRVKCGVESIGVGGERLMDLDANIYRHELDDEDVGEEDDDEEIEEEGEEVDELDEDEERDEEELELDSENEENRLEDSRKQANGKWQEGAGKRQRRVRRQAELKLAPIQETDQFGASQLQHQQRKPMGRNGESILTNGTLGQLSGSSSTVAGSQPATALLGQSSSILAMHQQGQTAMGPMQQYSAGIQQQQQQQLNTPSVGNKSAASSTASTGSNSSNSSPSISQMQRQLPSSQQSKQQQRQANYQHHHSSGQTNAGHKPTRIRTVLNEKQLETLRRCYGNNPRPDALIKEQLVEMTGLSPRVIRVWFQNKRCKDKKKNILSKQMAEEKWMSTFIRVLHLEVPSWKPKKLSSDGHRACLMRGIPLVASSPIQYDDHSTISSTPTSHQQQQQQQQQSQLAPQDLPETDSNAQESSRLQGQHFVSLDAHSGGDLAGSKVGEIQSYQPNWSNLIDYVQQQQRQYHTNSTSPDHTNHNQLNAESPRFEQLIGQIHGYNQVQDGKPTSQAKVQQQHQHQHPQEQQQQPPQPLSYQLEGYSNGASLAHQQQAPLRQHQMMHQHPALPSHSHQQLHTNQQSANLSLPIGHPNHPLPLGHPHHIANQQHIQQQQQYSLASINQMQSSMGQQQTQLQQQIQKHPFQQQPQPQH